MLLEIVIKSIRNSWTGQICPDLRLCFIRRAPQPHDLYQMTLTQSILNFVQHLMLENFYCFDLIHAQTNIGWPNFGLKILSMWLIIINDLIVPRCKYGDGNKTKIFNKNSSKHMDRPKIAKSLFQEIFCILLAFLNL